MLGLQLDKQRTEIGKRTKHSHDISGTQPWGIFSNRHDTHSGGDESMASKSIKCYSRQNPNRQDSRLVIQPSCGSAQPRRGLMSHRPGLDSLTFLRCRLPYKLGGAPPLFAF